VEQVVNNWHEFLTMGGFARFVWPSYGIVFVVLIASGWLARRRLRKTLLHAARRAQERRQ
jgi:heme exporter protein CcmD